MRCVCHANAKDHADTNRHIPTSRLWHRVSNALNALGSRWGHAGSDPDDVYSSMGVTCRALDSEKYYHDHDTILRVEASEESELDKGVVWVCVGILDCGFFRRASVLDRSEKYYQLLAQVFHTIAAVVVCMHRR
ncbi:hypothetical protein LshimejAT787_0212400 [Lyophyllum shimeji]|uniref:Uncharacterized protein n=1 Tax=Lyophyllum shimeji TaxID=47721 RepID=A0A9P3PGR8_LYOSH|nr:hypothetical protein LshimejAT787_0212400 [Lyophyllum shimeji]